MKTEYLITIDTDKKVATTCSSFNNLLMSNNAIRITEQNEQQHILYKNCSFNYCLQDNHISNTSAICYHMTIESDMEVFDPDNNTLKNYQELLRNTRSLFIPYAIGFEILWDDISYECSKKAYPLIYEIENLTRKLLTKFMLVNVGTKWEKENIPSKINKSKRKENDQKIENGLLYQQDFIALATFLFEPYALNNDLKNIKNLKNSDNCISYSQLEDYIPMSNWERYFSKIINVTNEQLAKKWDNLYELRCKVAHNNHFTITDLKAVQSIVDELKPSIESAILELDKIEIKNNNKEAISENFAIITHEQAGRFIYEFNKLNLMILEFINRNNVFSSKNSSKPTYLPMKRLIYVLQEKKLLDEEQHRKLLRVLYNRNNLVHNQHMINAEELNTLLSDIEELIVYFQSKL